MKMLVCVDGSKHSQKALNQAIEMATGCGINEVSLIHVDEAHDSSEFLTSEEIIYPTEENIKRVQKINKKRLANRKKMMEEASAKFKEHGIDVDTVIEKGHPSDIITKTANEGNYDMVIMGSRGLSGLKKIFLGSVSNAVIQETKASVLVVK